MLAKRDTGVIDRLIEADRKLPTQILVLGDGMTDVYVHCHLAECQDGCIKFVEESRVVVPGGAANAARSLENWESSCVFVGAHGPVKTRFMVGDQCTFRHDDDSNPYDLELIRREVWTALKWSKSRRWSAVLISDYDKGVLTLEMIRQVIRHCNEYDIPVVADAKRESGLYPGAILKCNMAWSVKYGDSDVLTGGALCPIVRGRLVAEGLPPVKCVNHVGAGDCFAAHLTLALAHGFTLEDATAIAHSAGRVYVQHPHNPPPTPSEIRADMLGVD